MDDGKASRMIIAFIIALDSVAFGLAIAAEQRNKKAKVLADWDTYRSYGSDAAMWFGVGVIFALLAGHALATATSRCLCCGKGLMTGSRICVLFLFVCCWLTFLIVEACLIAGTAYYINFKTNFCFESISCETIRKGMFGAGAAFSFFTCVLGVEYYRKNSKSRVDCYYEREPVIGMGAERFDAPVKHHSPYPHHHLLQCNI